MRGILKSLESSKAVKDYELLEYKTFSGGFYIKIKVNIKDGSLLYIREYSDINERNYSYHWQKKNGILITRWDNSPHHKKVHTFPHHKHTGKKIYPVGEVTLLDILLFIEKQIWNV
jgi:hypothetical protein